MCTLDRTKITGLTLPSKIGCRCSYLFINKAHLLMQVAPVPQVYVLSLVKHLTDLDLYGSLHHNERRDCSSVHVRSIVSLTEPRLLIGVAPRG